MDLVAGILIVLGFAASALGGIWLLVVAFRKSVRWGLANAFVPFANIIFLVYHPRDAWKPFAIGCAGVAVIGLGLACLMPAHPELMDDPIRAAQEGRLDENGNHIMPAKPASDSR